LAPCPPDRGGTEIHSFKRHHTPRPQTWQHFRGLFEQHQAGRFWYVHCFGFIHLIETLPNSRHISAGLATKRLKKPLVKLTTNEHSEATDIYEAIEDFSALLGENSKLSESIMSTGSANESLTGGGRSILLSLRLESFVY
jgi:hypothetical protein